MRSDTVKKGYDKAPHRSLFRAVGLKDADFDKPFIGVANSYVGIIPGHVHLQEVGRIVREAIYRGRRRALRVQHHRGGRRNRHGPHRDALLAAQPRADRGCHRDHGDGPLLRRAGDDRQLRQDRPRDADGRHAGQHPGDLCQRRPDGGGQDGRREGRGSGDGVRGRGLLFGRQAGRCGAARTGEDRLPHLRLLLRHVHGQLHELPGRGAGDGPAGQRHHPGGGREAEGALPGGGAADPDAGGAGSEAARHRHPRDDRQRLLSGHGHGRLDQHRPPHTGHRARSRDPVLAGPDQPAVRSRSVSLQGESGRASPRGGRGPGRRDQRHPEPAGRKG